MRRFLVALLLAGASGMAWAQTPAPAAQAPGAPPPAEQRAMATFAGGCFWCVEADFDKVEGVISTTSGYTGGHVPNPTYEQVSAGGTGHAESVQVVYDPSKTTYAKLLDIFWHNVDPFQQNGQFCDHGGQYRSAIFYLDESQRQAAEESKRKLEEQPRFRGKIATEIVPASTFYPAEEYHQRYYKKNPLRYSIYRLGCGRDARLKQVWGEAAGGHK